MSTSMRVLIADDEPLALDRLRRMVEKIPGYHVVAEANNGLQAIELADSHKPDILLLDIRMPGLDGLNAAKRITGMIDPPAIIFCTAYDEYAVEAFNAQAIGYLLKPVTIESLQEALSKAVKLNKAQLARLKDGQSTLVEAGNQRQHIAAKTRRGLELVNIDEIRLFLADQKYVTVHHSGGETLIDETLKDLEKEFPSLFLRVHRNALVALKYIDGLERLENGQYVVRIADTTIKPLVSRRHVPNVRKQIQGL